jgi:two-component system nitrate/nitrite response regulator NarL
VETNSSQATEVVKILVIDDHAVVRAGLRLLIERNPRFTVVGEAENMTEAVSLASREQPDIILLDIAMGDESGLNYIPKLVGACRKARILILTGVTDPKLHQRAIQLGAMGLLSKGKAPEVLAKAIEKVHDGEAWLDRMTMANVLTELSRPAKSNPFTEAAKIESITSREHEVICLVTQGLKNKQIAERLSISEITVRHHLTSIFSKLDLQDRFELIIFAFKHGLSDSPL